MESTSRLFGSGLKYVCDLVAIELRNAEALQLAQCKALESMGLLARRQAEIMEATFKRSLGAPVVPSKPAGGLPDAVIGQLASFKTTLLESQANSNLLSELAARGGGEVSSILQARMIAALEELTAALQEALPAQLPPVAPAPSTGAGA